MDEDNQVTEDTSTTPETVDVEETTDTEVDWEAKAKKAEELANNYKIRAEKAEKKAKENKPTDAQKVELSQLDILAIAKSDIHEEDIERVTKFAQMEGIGIREALANDDLKAILDRRTEARKVAEASNTSGSTASHSNTSPEALVANARQGKMPDIKDLDAFFKAEKKR